MARVRFEDTSCGIDAAVTKALDSFGSPRSLLRRSGAVFLKVNLIDSKPHVFTSVEVVRAIVTRFLAGGARAVYVIENSTQGNFTRLVFEATGMRRMCEETGAIPVYLDETAEMPMYLERLGSFVRIPDFVHEHLVRKRDENLYISVPKLKTHSMSTVTLGIKNQFGLLHHRSRIPDHNFRLHQKIADIYANIRPDLTLIDATEATNHGHYPATGFASECVVPLDLVIAGDDPLATDVVAAKFLGFDLQDVEHLRLAAAYRLGESDLGRIDIENRHLFEERAQHFSSDLLGRFPEDVRIIRGKTLCCREGCMRNTETVLEVFGRDFGGKGGFTILMGKGIDPAEAASVTGRVHIAGDCAMSEWYPELKARLGARNVTVSPGCNDLAKTIDGLAKQMGIPPYRLSPLSPLKSVALLAEAYLHGTRSNVTNVFRI
ncbi:MAG TPA: DUF362 domain-containing protein [Deltaproteobacteria bacterium]|nr:DUF362 domain-containing protein [Deltaproteobacteria bacterium]HPP81401.1 DUF362 domain-containing protein [Deltaproteobacteria bacterium]